MLFYGNDLSVSPAASQLPLHRGAKRMAASKHKDTVLSHLNLWWDRARVRCMSGSKYKVRIPAA